MTYPARSGVDEVRDRLDIVEVIGSVVPLQRSGRNFKARCPFHTERTPSFFVFPERGTWHCFGACATGGDVFTFVMRQEGISFPEALRSLAARAGVTLPDRRSEGESAAETEGRDRLRQALASAAHYYHHLLLGQPAGARSRVHLEERGLDRPTWERFLLGASPDAWQALTHYLLAQGYSDQELENAGLAIRGDNGDLHDRFRGRLIIPIRDLQSHVVGFGARTLDGSQPKYTNSPQTPLFDKGNLLYGLDLGREAIRQAGSAVLVEGYMDVLMAHQAGFANVVASMGTSITDRQVRLLKRYTHTLILALDADAAGDLATLRGIEVATQALDTTSAPTLSWRGLVRYREVLDGEVRILRLPPGSDPDEMIRAEAAKWQELQSQALPMVEYMIEAILGQNSTADAQAKTAAADRLLPLIGVLNDPVQQSHYLQRLARRLQVSEAALQQRLRALRPSRTRARTLTPEPSRRLDAPQAGRSVEEHCLALLLRYPALWVHAQQIPQELFRYAEHRALLAAIGGNKTDNEALTHYDEALEALSERIQQRQIPPLNGGSPLHALELTLRGLELQRLRQQELALAALLDAAEEARSQGSQEALDHWLQLHEQGMEQAARLRALWITGSQPLLVDS